MAARLVKFQKSDRTVRKIVFILLEINIGYDFKWVSEKILFISLALVSLGVTSNFFSSFLGFLQEKKLYVYDTLQAINDTNLPICIFDHFDWTEENDSVVEALRKKTEIVKVSPIDFLKQVTSTFITILPRGVAVASSNILKKIFPHILHRFMPSNITLFTARETLPFEKNSPFIDTFNKVYLRTKAFGFGLRASGHYEGRRMQREGNWFNYDWESPQRFKDVSGIINIILILYFIGVFLRALFVRF